VWQSFAQRVSDPLLRQALEMGALEEGAPQAGAGTAWLEAYGIHVAPEPVYLPPKDPEWAWLVTGYSECVDSFFCVRAVELARRSGYFPFRAGGDFRSRGFRRKAATSCFSSTGRLGTGASFRGGVGRSSFLKTCAVWLFLIWERIGIAKSGRPRSRGQDANFALTGSGSVGVALTPREVDRPVPIRE